MRAPACPSLHYCFTYPEKKRSSSLRKTTAIGIDRQFAVRRDPRSALGERATFTTTTEFECLRTAQKLKVDGSWIATKSASQGVGDVRSPHLFDASRSPPGNHETSGVVTVHDVLLPLG
jgi:hypothetical protein